MGFGAGGADADLMFVGKSTQSRGGEQPACRWSAQPASCWTSCGRDKAGSGQTCAWRTYSTAALPGDRGPLPQGIDDYPEFLFRQLELIRPKVVCGLGDFLQRELLHSDPPTGITRLHGREEVRVIGPRAVRLFPIYHPAAALYTRSLLDTLRADFARLPDLLALDPPPQPEPRREPEPVVPEPELVEEIEAAAPRSPRSLSSDCSDSVPSLRREPANGGW